MLSGGRTVSVISEWDSTALTIAHDGQLIVLLDVEQSVEELALENTDDSVQTLLQLLVLLHRALFLLPLVQFDPVLLQELQGPLSIFLSHRHDDSPCSSCVLLQL